MSRNALVAFGLLIGLTQSEGWAQTQIIDSTLVMDSRADSTVGMEILAMRGKPLLSVEVRPPNAVLLLGASSAMTKNPLTGKKTEQTLSDGQVIGAIPGREGLYCSPIRVGMITSSGACFLDQNNDGVFDSSVTASFHAFAVHGFAVTNKNSIYGVNLSKPAKLPEPISYKPAPYADGPYAQARLMWESNSRRVGVGGSVKFRLMLQAGDDSTGTGVFVEGDEVVLPGGAGTVEFYGIRLDVLGFDDNGNVRARVAALPKEQLVGFRFGPGYKGRLIY